jgi:hypothetical protein
MIFYFHVMSDDRDDIDAEGLDLPSLDIARQECEISAREMVAEMVLNRQPIDGMRFEIADEAGRVLATIPFRNLLGLH